jgi:quercetin dioxygenase-like cupin family protein
MATATAEKTYTKMAEDRTAAPHVIVHEDERSRIIMYTIRPGEQTGWHTHAFDYVVVRLSDGTLTSNFADGTKKDFEYKASTTARYEAPVTHNAVNTGTTDIVGYEIEFKA